MNDPDAKHLDLEFEGYLIDEVRRSYIEGMSLFDVLEMLVDWKAATERMAGGGDIRRSLEINRDRFKISPRMMAVLENTVREFGW